MGDKPLYELLSDVHETLELPPGADKCCLIKRSYKYYHYQCDGFNDVGWGCGYRTLRTICSWIANAKKVNIPPPDISTIQKILVDIADKPSSFYGSQEWIGAVEVSMVLNAHYDVQSRILHIRDGREFDKYTARLYEHFEVFGSPVMMGGDQDNSSKGIMGIALCGRKEYLLVVVPTTTQEWENLATEFEDKWNVFNAIGAMDGKHFCMTCPQLCGSHFYNYKSFNRIILFALTDANYQLSYIDVGTNGRIGDSGVFAN